MKRTIFALAIVSAACVSCVNNRAAGNPSDETACTDSTAVVADTLPVPVADPSLNTAARILTGIELDSSDVWFSHTNSRAWKSHKAAFDRMWDRSSSNLAKADTLASREFQDIRSRCRTVFYPFSGPDFLFPNTFFPDADTYWMFGLEPVGKPVQPSAVNEKLLADYRVALRTILWSSFFITKDMQKDLSSEAVAGVVPVLQGLIVRSGKEIISIDYFTPDSLGVPVPDPAGKMVGIKYFKKGSGKVQTLYYMSTNIRNSGLLPGVKACFAALDPETTVSYVKSCSYCLHQNDFSDVRSAILGHSFAFLQDDTGIPYKKIPLDEWDVTLFGKYYHPVGCFGEWVNQPELKDAYEKHGIKPLGFRIGYGQGANQLLGRRK